MSGRGASGADGPWAGPSAGPSADALGLVTWSGTAPCRACGTLVQFARRSGTLGVAFEAGSWRRHVCGPVNWCGCTGSWPTATYTRRDGVVCDVASDRPHACQPAASRPLERIMPRGRSGPPAPAHLSPEMGSTPRPRPCRPLVDQLGLDGDRDGDRDGDGG